MNNNSLHHVKLEQQITAWAEDRVRVGSGENHRRLGGWGVTTGVTHISGSVHHYANVKNELDITTDSATQITMIENSLSKLINELPPWWPYRGELDKIDATMLTAMATKILIDMKILAEMTVNEAISEFTDVTPNDAAATSPFTQVTRGSLIQALDDIQISPISIILARIYSTLIQYKCSAPKSREPGVYCCPIQKYVTLAELETLLSASLAVRGTYDGFRILGMDLRPATRKDITPEIVSPMSSLAWLICTFLPAGDDVSIITWDIDNDSPTYIYWHQALGVPSVLSIAPLLRATTEANTPGFLTPIAAAADKLNIAYAGPGDAAFTNYPDTQDGFDWLQSVANARSVNMTGVFSAKTPGVVQAAHGYSAYTAWNLDTEDWISDRMFGIDSKRKALHKVMNDTFKLSMMEKSYLAQTRIAEEQARILKARKISLEKEHDRILGSGIFSGGGWPNANKRNR